MTKQRGTPDRRGMGAQSDFITQPFVPSEVHAAEQQRRMRLLIAAGLPPEQVASLFPSLQDEPTPSRSSP